MPLYQTSKQLTKFGIVGITAVGVDLVVYYLLSQFLQLDVSKALGFASGTFVTYNLNKYWTWRQTDRSNSRLVWFLVLYGASMVVNVAVNAWMFGLLPASLLSIQLQGTAVRQLAAMKVNKLLAFVIATGFSGVFNFLGQKYWVFKEEDLRTDDEELHH